MLMTCRHVQQLHHAYVDGDLSPSLTAEFHAHLLQCPECQHQVELLRACGDVIAKDASSEPELDSGFAARVMAGLPKPAVESHPLSFTDAQDERRRLFWRRFTTAGVPAAAAALFLAVLIWPHTQPTEPDRPTFVLGRNTQNVVEPALSAVANAQRDARSLNQLLQLSVGQAGKDMKAGLAGAEKSAANTTSAPDEVSILDILLQPVNDMLVAPEPPAEDPKAEVVRF